MSTARKTAAERRKEEKAIHVLVVCGSAAAVKKSFKRKDEPVRFDQAKTPSVALDMITAQADVRPFDCVLIDLRRVEDVNPLNVVAIAAMRAFRKLVVICNEEIGEELETITGIDIVLPSSATPGDIIRSVISASPSKRKGEEELITIPKSELSKDGYSGVEAAEPTKKSKPKKKTPKPRRTAPDKPEPIVNKAELRDDIPVVPANDDIHHEQTGQAESAGKNAVTKGFESSLSLAAEADQQIWQRFVPVANFFYKKLAIVVLTALFLTFVTYGAMIVFFMGSSGWALPFELSRGHALVQKVERDLSSMRLRQNQIKQDRGVAQVEASKAMRDKRDGELQLTLTKRTVEEERILQNRQRLEIKKHIERLKEVIGDFNKLNGQGGFAKTLESAFEKRLITRKALNSGTLAVLETLHRIATVENEISQKQLELNKVNRRLEFLGSLLQEIDQPEVRVVTSAGADLSHLAREVIVAKNNISKAQKSYDSSHAVVKRLNNSLEVIQTNITSLEKTPAARALQAPVMVLFVPYTNTESLVEGERLYGCRFSIVVCNPIGRVGPVVNGETTAVHPLFGKPLRGTFVEAEFYDPRSVTQELVHAGGSPLLF